MDQGKISDEKQKALSDSISNITDIEVEMDSATYHSPSTHSSKPLIDIANNTFKELCQTLETEQKKLMELEDRRKKLQEDMLRLKQEIEDEKNAYSLDLEDYDVKVPDVLKAMERKQSDSNEPPLVKSVPANADITANQTDAETEKRIRLAQELRDLMQNITDVGAELKEDNQISDQ